MNIINIRCTATTTNVPGENIAQCDLEFGHNERHQVCFGHGAYTYWEDNCNKTVT